MKNILLNFDIYQILSLQFRYKKERDILYGKHQLWRKASGSNS